MTVPEKVDLVISELFGYMMYNERTLESYIHARKWLKPGGKYFARVNDESIVVLILNKNT